MLLTAVKSLRGFHLQEAKKESPIKVHTAHSKNRGSGINDEDFVAITLQRELPVSTDER